MNYKQFLNQEAQRLNFEVLKKAIEKARKKTALLYAHDDPDGIASGIILKQVLEKNNFKVFLEIPTTMELEKWRFQEDVKKYNPEIVFVCDKATMGYYDEYYKIHPQIFIIDHHPLLGEPLKNINVINPVLDGYKRCSASFVCFLIADFLGFRDEGIEIAALIGLKGDWAIEPATEEISDYVRPFYDEVKEKFAWLLKKIKSRPTMFEVRQRQKTTLLNQITEIIFALGGGGFQYFYNDRAPELKDVVNGEFAFYQLEEFLKAPLRVQSEEEFLNSLKEKQKAKKIFDFYLSDWEHTTLLMKSSVFVKSVKDTDIFLFVASNVKLMPMVGSVVLYNMRGKSKDTLFIMVSEMGEKGVHFSFRGKLGNIHCGDFAHALAMRLAKKFNSPEITGGGHPFAAEARTRMWYPFDEVMIEFFKKLEEV